VPVLKKYAQHFKVMDNKWSMVTGNEQTVYDLCMNGFKLPIERSGPKSFDHSTKCTLVDNHGIIRGYYDGLDSLQVEKLKGDIVILLKELSNDVNALRPPRN
jgi:protein SCO1